MQFLWIALGGALGALSRYLVGAFLFQQFKWGPPWSTLIVNVTGCLVMGIMFAWVEVKSGLSSELRQFMMIGFLGAYTTFSTYMLEVVSLIDLQRYSLAFTSIILSTALGFVFFILGTWLTKNLIKV
ncbi:MAG: fluoride efflux transporter CrcB [Deltaproteobacteria bacterium]|nr:fluoride efflux transporter CrcB [Deltaproteobacteria bacterium]